MQPSRILNLPAILKFVYFHATGTRSTFSYFVYWLSNHTHTHIFYIFYINSINIIHLFQVWDGMKLIEIKILDLKLKRKELSFILYLGKGMREWTLFVRISSRRSISKNKETKKVIDSIQSINQIRSEKKRDGLLDKQKQKDCTIRDCVIGCVCVYERR